MLTVNDMRSFSRPAERFSVVNCSARYSQIKTPTAHMEPVRLTLDCRPHLLQCHTCVSMHELSTNSVRGPGSASTASHASACCWRDVGYGPCPCCSAASLSRFGAQLI